MEIIDGRKPGRWYMEVQTDNGTVDIHFSSGEPSEDPLETEPEKFEPLDEDNVPDDGEYYVIDADLDPREHGFHPVPDDPNAANPHLFCGIRKEDIIDTFFVPKDKTIEEARN